LLLAFCLEFPSFDNCIDVDFLVHFLFQFNVCLHAVVGMELLPFFRGFAHSQELILVALVDFRESHVFVDVLLLLRPVLLAIVVQEFVLLWHFGILVLVVVFFIAAFNLQLFGVGV